MSSQLADSKLRPSAYLARLALRVTVRAVVFAAFVLHLAHANANEQAEEMLRQAEKNYEQLDYEQALKTLIEVQQMPDLTAVQRARCYLYMGVAFTALGRAENAVQAFMEVLKIRPTFRLPAGVSPSILAMFGQALKRLNLPEQAPAEEGATPEEGAGTSEGAGATAPPSDTGTPTPPPATPPGGGPSSEPTGEEDDGSKPSPVQLAVRAPEQVATGKQVELRIEVDDPKRLTREIVIRWRRNSDSDYSTVKLAYEPGLKQISGTIPAASIGDWKGRLLYFVEARDSSGNTLGSAGTDETPRRINVVSRVETDKRRTWYWWVLGVGGAAAVITGGVLAAVLLSTGGSDQAKLTINIH